VLLWGGFQADLRLVARDSLGAALQYFTGSKTHNIALRDRAIQRGWKLNEYGLYADDGSSLAGASETHIYERLGLDWIPPELRENRGEIDAAERHDLPRLITMHDLRGDLHMHTTATDGRADAESMALAARDAGLEYIAITDHSRALAMSNGLDERAALQHAQRIRELNGRLDGITVLAGIECDIRPDGSMDLADDCLAQLDIVVASVHSAFAQEETQMTDRVLRAIANPWVDVVGHPTGRLILKRDGYRLNIERVIAAAAEAGVALEINSQIDRLDLNEHYARLARDRGVKLVIDSDAHSPAALGVTRWGVTVARRAWVTPADVLNTLPVGEFRAALRRNRTRDAR
jgi:DNA polymerase (family 10)